MKLLRLIILFFVSQAAFSQQMLKIHSADLLKQNPLGGRIIYGNVDIEYDVYRIKCDSAVINKDLTNARLFKNIQFSDTSRTIFCENATLSETPAGRMAFLRDNVRLSEKDVYITGKEATLNEVSKRITVTDSVIAEYYEYPSILFCSELNYDTEKEIVSSRSVDSVLYVDSLRYYRLYTNIVSYDAGTQELSVSNKFDLYSKEFVTPVENWKETEPSQIDKISKSAEFSKEAFFSAGRGTFFFDPADIETSIKCSFRQIDKAENDTVLFDADRVTYSETEKTARANGNVKIRNKSLLINSGSAKYFEDEKIVKFHDEPVITYEAHKITGDSVTLNVGSDGFYPEKGTIYGNPLYTSLPDEKFPQEKNILKGKLMDLWFLNKEISKIIVSKEAEALYFVRGSENNTSEASNYLLGDILTIDFEDGDIKSASIEGGSEGIYYPERLKLNALKKIEK
jgi:lipopolysaccharide export system protein LptA